jgi:hypothetical protein
MNIIETIIVTISSGLFGGFISYYFAEKTENYKFELLKKEQAAKVAELLAFWIRHDNDTVEKLLEVERRDYAEKLNRLTWELSIWIRDEKIIKKIMKKLSNESGADIKQIILEIREEIQRKKSKELKWEDIVSFKPNNFKK